MLLLLLLMLAKKLTNQNRRYIDVLKTHQRETAYSTVRVREGEKNGYEIQHHDCIGLGPSLGKKIKYMMLHIYIQTFRIIMIFHQYLV